MGTWQANGSTAANCWRGWGTDPIRDTILSVHTSPLSFVTYSYVPCSDLDTRVLKWINPCQNNGSRPDSYVHCGVSAVSIAAQYAEAHAAPHPCPVSGWRSTQWG
jgi:hypothetical protein